MLTRLDRETRPLHHGADAGWRDLLVNDVTETEYGAQLARIYGFEGPLEAALAYTPNIAPVVDVKRRMRAGLIALDLTALHIQASQIAKLSVAAIAPFADVADALGWMYVVERATPLHSIVRDHVLRRLPHLANAATYLAAYETSIGSRWLELGAALDRVAHRPGGSDRILAGAFEGFLCATAWYHRHRPRLQRAG